MDKEKEDIARTSESGNVEDFQENEIWENSNVGWD